MNRPQKRPPPSPWNVWVCHFTWQRHFTGLIKYLQLSLGYPGGPNVIASVPTQEQQESPGQRKGCGTTERQRWTGRHDTAGSEGGGRGPGASWKRQGNSNPVGASRRNAALRTHLKTSNLKNSSRINMSGLTSPCAITGYSSHRKRTHNGLPLMLCSAIGGTHILSEPNTHTEHLHPVSEPQLCL